MLVGFWYFCGSIQQLQSQSDLCGSLWLWQWEESRNRERELHGHGCVCPPHYFLSLLLLAVSMSVGKRTNPRTHQLTKRSNRNPIQFNSTPPNHGPPQRLSFCPLHHHHHHHTSTYLLCQVVTCLNSENWHTKPRARDSFGPTCCKDLYLNQ